MHKTTTSHWEINQLVKSHLFPDKEAVLRSALRALFHNQPEIRRQMVIRTYTTGEISLGKAAQMLGVSHEEMKEIIVEAGERIHLGPREIEDVLQDAANA